MNKQPDPPIIFALSNPTSRSECSAEQAVEHSQGRAIFSSGSPFDDVVWQGKTYFNSQCNNKYIFPGLALGASLAQAGSISEGMLMCAAESLAQLLQRQDIDKRLCFPESLSIREISCSLATSVIMQAHKEGKELRNDDTLRALLRGHHALYAYVKSQMWEPEYRPIVQLNPGEK